MFHYETFSFGCFTTIRPEAADGAKSYEEGIDMAHQNKGGGRLGIEVGELSNSTGE